MNPNYYKAASNLSTKKRGAIGVFSNNSASSVSHPLSVVASTLVNAQRAGHRSVQFAPNRCGGLVLPLLSLLNSEGYIQSVEVSQTNQKNSATVHLRYDGRGQPAIRTLRLISLPSRRIYLPSAALWQPQSTVGRLIVSTTEGLLTDREARRRNLGGEVIRRIRLAKHLI